MLPWLEDYHYLNVTSVRECGQLCSHICHRSMGVPPSLALCTRATSSTARQSWHTNSQQCALGQIPGDATVVLYHSGYVKHRSTWLNGRDELSPGLPGHGNSSKRPGPEQTDLCSSLGLHRSRAGPCAGSPCSQQPPVWEFPTPRQELVCWWLLEAQPFRRGCLGERVCRMAGRKPAAMEAAGFLMFCSLELCSFYLEPRLRSKGKDALLRDGLWFCGMPLLLYI